VEAVVRLLAKIPVSLGKTISVGLLQREEEKDILTLGVTHKT
jgi:hypothetical protein